MSATEQDFTNQLLSSTDSESKDGNYFAFVDNPSPENLAANRVGILTPQQQAALQTNISYQKTTYAIIIGTLIATVIFLCFLFWQIDSVDGTLSTRAQLINAGLLIVLFGIFASFLTGDWFVYSMGDDLENRVVRSSPGRMEWDGRRYRMYADARPLRFFRRGIVLPPSEYRFYYLPHTGLVIMAEELETSLGQHTSLLLRTLASANRFSLDELKSNREGALSKHQENELMWIAALAALIGLSSAVVFVILLPRLLGELPVVVFVLALLIGMILLLRFMSDSIRIMSDVWHGEISKIEGPVSKKVRRSRYSHSYFYVSGPYRFQVSRTAYTALIEGKMYRIFYVPRSKRLVSIEPA